MPFRVALIQLTTGNDPEAAGVILEEQIEKAALGGAKLITTPETSHLMEMNRARVLEKARYEAEEPLLGQIQALAKAHGIWIHLGSLIIKVADDKLANRSYLINSDGDVTATYTKLHLFDVDLGGGEVYRESALYQAGDAGVVTETPWGKIGLSICYDLRFPSLYRMYAAAGADILMVPSAFTKPTGEAHWHTLLKARAIENGAFVLAAAQTGMHATGRETYGHSLAIDPWGEVLTDAGTSTGVFFADLDLEKVAKTRKRMPSLSHVRDFGLLHS